MKITRIEAIPLLAPAKKPWKTGVASFSAFYTTLVRVETDDGNFGYGESLSRYRPNAWAEIINEVLAPIVIGTDQFDVEHLWERMYRSLGSFSGHSHGIFVESISGIDIALWDLMGKATNKPVTSLLGGSPRSLAAYASPVAVAPLPEMISTAESLVENGFTRLKVKIGRDAATERVTLAGIREAVGPSVTVLVDANGAYTFGEAVRVARMLEEFDVGWFEEPFRTEYRSSYSKLRQHTSIPLAAGEGEFTRWGMHELLSTQAIDVIQPDVARSGGITETRKLWSLASLYHAGYAPHLGAGAAVCAAASLHLAAAAPNFIAYECNFKSNPLRDELVLEPVGHWSQVRDGSLELTDKPGLGIEINQEIVDRYRVSS